MAEEYATPMDDPQFNGSQEKAPAPVEGQTTEGQPAQAEGTPAQPDFDPNHWQLNVKGQQIVPKDRQHLIDLAQKGSSFESNQAAFNQERISFQSQIQNLEQYKPMDQWINGDQAKIQALNQFITGYGQKPAPDYIDEETAQGFSSVHAELAEMKQKFQTQEQREEARAVKEADTELNTEISDLRKTYPKYNFDLDDGTGNLERKVLQFASDNGINNLTHAFRVMMFDSSQTSAKMDALKQQTQSVQQQSKAGVVTQGMPVGQSVKKIDFKNKSMGTLAEEAKLEYQ